MKLICQFLHSNNGYLFFRRLERVFEEERNEKNKKIVEVLQQANNPKKRTRN